MRGRVSQSSTELKTCKVCLQDKLLSSEFPFHSSTGYYSNYCRECHNRRRRIKLKGLEDPPEFAVLKKAPRKPRKIVKNIPYRKTSPANRRMIDYRMLDKRKGMENNITIDFINSCLSSPCVYCGYPPTGLDRKDNTKGHTIENCVSCCKDCNLSRGDKFTHEEMKIIGKAIREVKDKRVELIKCN